MRNKLANFIDRLLARPKPISRWDPIIVYQMGKVGSASIQHSLMATFKAMGVKVPVHHIHNLNNLEAMEKAILQSNIRHDPEVTLMGIRLGLELKKQMNEDPNKQWNLISMVRDPVARNVSDFFHGLQEIIPDCEHLYQTGQLSIEDVQAAFLTKFDHHITPKVWFDTQMKTVFKIDVYARPFPSHKGFEIYRDGRNAQLLLMRLEDMNRVAGQAMTEFLHIRDFRLIQSNVGAEKPYASLYRDFKKLPLPEAYLEEIYGTKFAKHFYTGREIENFREKWALSDKE
jgi:hypothetical protein